MVAFESILLKYLGGFHGVAPGLPHFMTRYRISGSSSRCYGVGMVSGCKAWRDNLPGVQCAGDKFMRQLAPYIFDSYSLLD